LHCTPAPISQAEQVAERFQLENLKMET
jgi:hypothetical protein